MEGILSGMRVVEGSAFVAAPLTGMGQSLNVPEVEGALAQSGLAYVDFVSAANLGGSVSLAIRLCKSFARHSGPACFPVRLYASPILPTYLPTTRK